MTNAITITVGTDPGDADAAVQRAEEIVTVGNPVTIHYPPRVHPLDVRGTGMQVVCSKRRTEEVAR